MGKERIEYLKKDFVQGFPAYCGFEVEKAAYGRFETRLKLRPEHHQQDGFAHAGVMATMADHTAGYAAFTTVPESFRILTIEFKINFFKPALGSILFCRAKVIKPGRTIIVAESELLTKADNEEKSVAKAMVTLMAVPAVK